MPVEEIKIGRPQQVRPCKICATASPLYGAVDFNKNCEARRFNIVSCFEMLEHVPDPRRQIAEIAKCVGEEGLVIFSTLVQPPEFDKIGLDWWYVGPRNGHISLFSRRALAEVWNRQGFDMGSFSENLHMAYVKVPAFAKHLVRR